MMIILESGVTPKQLEDLLGELEVYVKSAVDIERGILAGGGALQADCEEAFLAEGCKQDSIRGADWIPATQEIRYDALINLRPKQRINPMTIDGGKE